MRRAWVSDLEKFEKIFQSPYGVWTVCRAARGVSRVRRRTVRLTVEKFFQSPKLLEKIFKVQSIVRVFFFKVLDLKDNRWSPTHFSSIRRATLSRSVACEKRPGNTVPGSVKVVRGTERELKPVNGVGTRDGRANRYLALPQRLFVFTARRRGNYVKAYALPRTRTKKNSNRNGFKK